MSCFKAKARARPGSRAAIAVTLTPPIAPAGCNSANGTMRAAPNTPILMPPTSARSRTTHKPPLAAPWLKTTSPSILQDVDQEGTAPSTADATERDSAACAVDGQIRKQGLI